MFRFYFTHLILFDELFSLFAASSLRHGTGLSFRPREVAKALSVAGPSMCTALLTFPWLTIKINYLSLYRLTAVIFVVIYPLFSFLPELGNLTDGSQREPRILLWACLLILMVVRYAVLAIGLTSLQVLVSLMSWC